MARRRPLPVLQPQPPLVACTECARCCGYVAVGINAPGRSRYATDVLWYLYHEGVSVHLDGAGEWSVVFEARCRNLGHDRLCGIYEQRPHICRAFDNTTCEVNSPDGGRTFTRPEEFLDWLRGERPRLYRRIAKSYVPASLQQRSPSRSAR
jgi:Fe-S-cluster containining protein